MLHQDVSETTLVACDGPSGRFGHTATMLSDGRMILVGGRDGARYHADVWAYGVAPSRWATLECVGVRGQLHCTPRARAGHTAVATGADRVIIFGGAFCAKTTGSDVWQLDVATGEWALLDTGRRCPCDDDTGRPAARRGHTAVARGDSMFVFGGANDVRSDSTLWEWRVTARQWVRRPAAGQPPTCRQYHVAAATEDGATMVVIGGKSAEKRDTRMLSDVHAFDFASDTWRQITVGGCVPAPRMCAAATIRDDVVCMCYGTEYGGGAVDDYEIDLRSGRWRCLRRSAAARLPRCRPTMASSGNTLVVFGGAVDGGKRCCTAPLHITLAAPSLKECCRRWLRSAHVAVVETPSMTPVPLHSAASMSPGVSGFWCSFESAISEPHFLQEYVEDTS
jgi:hypothetical protein